MQVAAPGVSSPASYRLTTRAGGCSLAAGTQGPKGWTGEQTRLGPLRGGDLWLAPGGHEGIGGSYAGAAATRRSVQSKGFDT